MASSSSVSTLVAQYGYWMVVVGALAEGESVLLAAGFAAHRGLLQLPWVIALAFIASSLGDQFCFYMGRRHGPRLLARFPSLRAKVERMRPLLQRYPSAAIVSVRFLYGLRTAGPVALGALGVPRWKFVLLNLASAALWATGFALLGYQFGNALQWWLKDLRAVEEGVLTVLLLAAVAVPLWWRLRHGTAA